MKAQFPAVALALFLAGPVVGRPMDWSKARARIMTGESASVVLGAWCRSQSLPRLIAVREPVAQTTPSAVRSALRLRPGEPVRRRRVRLMCGGLVLSQAENWYRPERLTPAMNRALAGREPFGLVTRPLGFRRLTLAAQRDTRPGRLLRVRAILIDARGVPFSFVDEVYSSVLLTSR